MSKQSEAKLSQGWKRQGPFCGNCQMFTSEVEKRNYGCGEFDHEINLRCSHGGFKTGKSSWCSSHQWREG